MDKIITGHNKGLPKAGVSCFYDSEVLNSSFVHLMNFCTKNSPPSAIPKPLPASFTNSTSKPTEF